MGTRLIIDATTVYEIDEECMACAGKEKMSDVGDTDSCYTVDKAMRSRPKRTEEAGRG